MTPDDLEQLILENNDTEAVRLAFKGMDEKARKKLSSTASALQRQLWDGKANATSSDRLTKFLKARKEASYTHWNSRANSNAALAVFAVGPLSAVKKWQTRPSYEDSQVLRKIIADRRPEWLEDWVHHELEQEWTRIEFPTLRIWIRDGLISRPESDGYYRLFASHLMRTGFYGRDKEAVPPLSKQLLDDPALLDDIEWLFRIETNAFNTNSWLVKGAADHYETWPQALVKLADGGHYDRGKLLDLALAGLQADIKQNQLSGYHKFFRLLKPGDDQLAARQPALVALLCHPVGHVAKFAIDMLAGLEKAKLLDDDQVLREMPSVFSGEGKGNGIAALRLLEKVARRTARQAEGRPDANALGAVIEGLRHAHADVQAKAIALLTTYADALDRAQWQDIESFGAFMSVSNRAAMNDLLGQAGDAIEPASIAAAPAAVDEAASYTPDIRSFAECSVLGEANRLEPVKDLQELIDLAFHCAEIVDDVDEIERLLDGISRFADQRPADFQDRVNPLIHRMSKRGSSHNGLASAYPGVAESVRALVLTWAMGELRGSHKQELVQYSREDAFVPMITFLHWVARHVHRREPRQLLSTPTHEGGWIDPVVWTERLQHLASNGTVEDSIDFRLSLLRLAPDNRCRARANAEALAGNAGRLARFALGGDEAPVRNDRKHYVSWITAARARDPMADWSELFEPLDIDDPWPGGAVPSAYRWHSAIEAGQHGDMRWKTPIFEVEVERADGKSNAAANGRAAFSSISRLLGVRKRIGWEAMPTAAVHQHQSKAKYHWYGDLNTTWVAQWLGYIWPQDPAFACYRGVRKLMQRVDDNASNWTPAHGFFKALFVRGRPWGEAGHLLLALGLVGKDADAKGLAVDALIEGIETRQFNPALFADVMARVSAGEWVKYNRLGESLKQVVQVSPVHANAIGAALLHWLPKFDLGQRNAFHVLEALVEAQAIAPQSLGLEARTAFGQLSGKTKAAKLAQQMLA
ncbi:DUF6493 family protein [Aurantiacibacter marinus]|uniref:Uncharacterized protein n=1 Tax=Aurantiacibacter marinus TaxID=874156 RepID=A0A0H0XM07_9SPHN|nr:DUF6493 family protein [Aurantiacibacter marinus]KLI62992.1 hypothetical protein AAV99_13225 [Aurantiacibacter marinus]